MISKHANTVASVLRIVFATNGCLALIVGILSIIIGDFIYGTVFSLLGISTLYQITRKDAL